jgi:hypothetical protein
MAGTILKIDNDFGKEPVPRGDFSDTPTAVRHKSKGANLEQRIDLGAGDFPGGCQFF